MRTKPYNCPCCGSSLTFDGSSNKLRCSSCGNAFDSDVLEDMNSVEAQNSIDFQLPEAHFSADDSTQMQGYFCKNCGAELITENTATATECPYCGSPTILPDRIDSGVRPEKVVPFVITKEQAQQQFENYFKGKRLLPNVFLRGGNHISEIRKLYVPYWLFNCDAYANIVYDAERTHTERNDDWEITHTEHYLVRRSGSMAFENIPVDGSAKLDDNIAESLEPYDLSTAIPFQPAVLAGSLADHADVDSDACKSRAVERVENSIANAMHNTVNGYTSVTERSRHIRSEGGKVTPVLMPVWLITTEKEGKTYTNRQADMQRACGQGKIRCLVWWRVCRRAGHCRTHHGADRLPRQWYIVAGRHRCAHCRTHRAGRVARTTQASGKANHCDRLCAQRFLYAYHAVRPFPLRKHPAAQD